MKILWKRGEIAPQEQFLLLSTIFYNLILDFCVITRTRFFLRDKRLFEITEVEITRVDCTFLSQIQKWMSKAEEIKKYLEVKKLDTNENNSMEKEQQEEAAEKSILSNSKSLFKKT